MRMKWLSQFGQEIDMMPSTKIQMVVHPQFGHILNYKPNQAIGPYQEDIRPGYFRHKDTQTDNERGYNLGNYDGTE